MFRTNSETWTLKEPNPLSTTLTPVFYSVISDLPPQNQGWNNAPNGQVPPPPNQGYNNQPYPNQPYSPNPNPTYNNYPPQNQGIFLTYLQASITTCLHPIMANNPWFLGNSRCQTSTKVIFFFLSRQNYHHSTTLFHAMCHVWI